MKMLWILATGLLATAAVYAADDCENYENYSDNAPGNYQRAPESMRSLIRNSIGFHYFLGENPYVAQELGLTYKEDSSFWKVRPINIWAYTADREINCSNHLEIDGLWRYTSSIGKTGHEIIFSMTIGKVLDDQYNSADVFREIMSKFPGLERLGTELRGNYQFDGKYFRLDVFLYGTADNLLYRDAQWPYDACGDEHKRRIHRTIIEYVFWNDTDTVNWFLDCREKDHATREKGKKIKID